LRFEKRRKYSNRRINILFKTIKNYDEGFPKDKDEISLSKLLNMNSIKNYDDQNNFFLYDEDILDRKSVPGKATGSFILKSSKEAISDKDAMEKHGAKKIKTIVQEEKINNANSLFLRIERKQQKQKFVPDEQIILGEKVLHLRAMTVHVNNRTHFNLRFYDSSSKSWYKYDGTDTTIMKIGNFKELMKDEDLKTKTNMYWYNVD
jgi:hypothetical protein